jgi:hypothetical protein
VSTLQYYPEYVMTLHARKENYTGPDRTVGRTADRTAGHTADHTASRTAEVAIHDPSVCAGSARNVESRMDLRTAYPTDQEYQQTT